MSLNYMSLADGRALPVGTGIMPVCSFDQDGKPAGAATDKTLADLTAFLFARKGETYIHDDTLHEGDWFAVTAVEDTVIASITTPTGTHTDVPIPGGLTLPLQFTAVTLTSGKVFAWIA
ncbi:MAG TPA: hypothetical protein VNQ90_17655 [Chthoniobacteraceae bacterium]|nr:hypothetical protein [Chthoniobacteraceae bacterium]